jgi:hypothetical protein
MVAFIHHIPEASPLAPRLCGFNVNVAHISTRQESESSVSEMDTRVFHNFIAKSGSKCKFSPANFEYIVVRFAGRAKLEIALRRK